MSDDLFAPEAFDEFYFAVHDRKPFAWQTRLASHVCRTRSKKDTEDPWPMALDVPTGAGKTSAIDVAIFHLAREVARVEASPSGTPRVAALRIFFVVDRRLVVDDAFRHAQKLARKLKGAQSGVLAAAARNLLKLAEFGSRDAEPLNVTRLRGGAPKDYDWVRSPSQPTVVLSTVDQVGSRLLFRGYGVSDGMKPVHAALVGNDALVLLDEAHLSNPFVGTLRSIASQRRGQTPFQVVTLSATQKGASHEFIEPKDLEDVSPGSLGRRLRCAKRARLVLVKENKDPAANATQFVKEFVRAARYHLDAPDAQAVAVVVNRVRRARAIFEELTRDLREQAAPIDVILLTGRSRPLDRDALLATNRKRIATDPNRVPATRRLVVVATQCVEAGADLDFDALITEVAPLDALRQRFGRLHRLGRPVDATVTKRPSATILACGDQVASRAKPDPIYGDALRATWELLSQKASKPSGGRKRTTDETVADDAPTIDFGVESSKGWLPRRDDLTRYLAPAGSLEGPLLTPTFLAQWACTSPVPAAEADVSLFLHGKQSSPADVQLVWRADLDERWPEERWAEQVAVCPPSSLEALAVPYFEARRWLAMRATAEIGDVEGASDDDLGEQSNHSERVGRAALRWRGKDDAHFVSRRNPVSPGDTIVVPATYGGADRWGWWPVDERTGNTEGNPSAKRRHHNTRPTPVTDLGDIANRLHRRSDILRLSPLLLGLARRDELIEDGESRIDAEKHAARARRGFERIFAHTTEDGKVSAAELTREALNELLLGFDELPRAWRAWLARDDAFRVHRSEHDVPLALERKLSLDEMRSLTPARAVEASPPQGEGRTTLSTDADDDLGSEGTDGDLGGEATTEDDESSLPAPRTGRVARKVSVLLSQHSKGVGDIAKKMALLAGFPEDRVEDIALAGFLHDAGKAHPDFQALLFGGDEIAAELARVSGKALAKSGRLKLDRAARDRAKLPAGARHEVASLWLALAHPAFAKAHDRDLVLWLVGTHHGHGRPFFPAVEWPRPGETFIASLDEGAEVASQPAASLASLTARWAALYERLSRELGLWELAYCEAVVRLADHRVSELEQRADATSNISTRPTTRRSAHASSLQAHEEDRP